MTLQLLNQVLLLLQLITLQQEKPLKYHNFSKRGEKTVVGFHSRCPPAACTVPSHLPVQLKSLCFLSPIAGSVLEVEPYCPLSRFHAHASNSPPHLRDPVRQFFFQFNSENLTKTCLFMCKRLAWFFTDGRALLNAAVSSAELLSMPLSGPEAVVSPLRSSSTEHSHSFTLRLCSVVSAPSLSSSCSSLSDASESSIYREELVTCRETW